MIPQFRNKKVLCIGEVLWDNHAGQSRPGGALLNIANHLLNFNIPVKLISKVGTDAKGIELLEHMRKVGLNTEAIYFDDALPTSEVQVNIDKFNNIKYKVEKLVAWDKLHINMRIIDHAGEAGTIVYGSLASRSPETKKTIEVLLSMDAIKVMDVNLRPPYVDSNTVEFLMRKADIINLTDKELDQILSWRNKVYNNEKDRLKWVSDYYNCDIVCLTKGANGALAFHKDILFTHPGYKVDAVDYNGTGAGFLAGFIASLINSKSIHLSLEEACAYSALLSTSSGAVPDYFSEGKKKILKKLNKIKTTTY